MTTSVLQTLKCAEPIALMAQHEVKCKKANEQIKQKQLFLWRFLLVSAFGGGPEKTFASLLSMHGFLQLATCLLRLGRTNRVPAAYLRYRRYQLSPNYACIVFSIVAPSLGSCEVPKILQASAQQ